MASHQELANFIKNVHAQLRLKSRQVGAEVAWEEHCHDSELLKKYSSAMKDLATEYWEKNNSENSDLNRIHWVVKECEHFSRVGHQIAAEKEAKMNVKYFSESLPVGTNLWTLPLKLLDVGSCYNPFGRFDLFHVTAIDIAPASEDVVQCDFLNAEVGQCPYLPFEGFDVVLFSFLLEYLPHPKMRFECCHKAHQLLRPGGILIILTPDSNHDSANSRMMKSWRHSLAHIGFMRINSQKLKHLRCLTYYKCRNSEAMRKWLSTQRPSASPQESIVIPQDANSCENRLPKKDQFHERSESEVELLAENFADMAGTDVFNC